MSQHYLYELVIKTLVHHNLFYMLHQFLQYHVLSDSKPLVSSHLKIHQLHYLCKHSLSVVCCAEWILVPYKIYYKVWLQLMIIFLIGQLIPKI